MDDLVKALRSGEQADMDGTLVKVSRQACEEAADAIEALQGKLRDMHRRAQTAEAALREPIEAAAPERRTLGRVLANAAFYAEYDRAEALQAQLAEARDKALPALDMAAESLEWAIREMDEYASILSRERCTASRAAETTVEEVRDAIRALKGERG